MKRNDKLIKKKLYSYLLPSIIMIAALQLGNFVDAIIVGNLLGSYATSAINLAVPVIFILQLPSILFGVGGATTVSVYLGKRDIEKASGVFSFAIVANLVCAVALGLLVLLFEPLLVQLLTGGGAVTELVSPILRVYGVGMPFVCVANCMAYLMNVDNNPGKMALMHIVSNVINLILDYLLIRYTPVGIAGSALSTVLGYTLSGAGFIILYAKSNNRMLHFSWKHLKSKAAFMTETVKSGIPSVSLLLMQATGSAVINANILRTLGQDMMAVYAVTVSSMQILKMCVEGIVGVIATIAGVLYGEMDVFGIKKIMKRIIAIVIVVCLALTAFFMAFPGSVAKLYGFSLTELLPVLNTCLRFFSLSFLVYGLNSIMQNYYRTIGQILPATLTTVLELFLIHVPVSITAMHVGGVKSMFFCVFFTELATFVTIQCVRLGRQRAGKMPQKGIFAIPEENERTFCDITIEGSIENAVEVSQKLIDYCKDNGIDPKKATAIGIAAEEIATNISKYGYKKIKRNFIDICLSKVDDMLILRIRDDGAPFNPLDYAKEEKDKYQITGLELIKKLSGKLSYTRVLNMNNTVFEIKL